MGVVDRNHDPADALDEHDVAMSHHRPARKIDQRIEVDGTAFAPRRHRRRQRCREAPARDAVEIGRRPAEGVEQNAGIARREVLRIKTADHRLDCVARPAGGAQIADEADGDEGLADVGPGRGDEDRGHASS